MPRKTDTFQFGETESGASRRVPVTLVRPEGHDPARAYPLVVALPPGPGDAAMVDVTLAHFQEIAEEREIILAVPEILGPTLDEQAADFVAALFAWLGENAQVAAAVSLVGQSNGGIGAFHLAVAEPDRFREVLVFPGVYRGDHEDLGVLKGKRVKLMVGEHDAGWPEGAARMEKALGAVGARPERQVFPGQGHVFLFNPNEIFDWIAAGD